MAHGKELVVGYRPILSSPLVLSSLLSFALAPSVSKNLCHPTPGLKKVEEKLCHFYPCLWQLLSPLTALMKIKTAMGLFCPRREL